MHTHYVPSTLELNKKEANNKIKLKLEILWKQMFLKVYQIPGRFGVEEEDEIWSLRLNLGCGTWASMSPLQSSVDSFVNWE